MFALATVTCTLAGFVLTSVLGISPAWAALAGAAVLAARALARRRTTPAAIVRAASAPFPAFVLPGREKLPKLPAQGRVYLLFSHGSTRRQRA